MRLFDKYVEQYNLNNYDIAYKFHHSYRVQELSNLLAKKLNLNEEDLYLANIIGLLHDIGRFKQLEVYKTYEDSKSIDHADYGVKVLFDDNVIDRFNIENKYYDIIRKAIKNHNKFKIEQGLNEQELLHAKIIRDTDKIDIFNAYTDLEAYDITSNLGEITKEVENEFKLNKSVALSNTKTRADELLLTLSFVFDINFDESIVIIKEKDYINKLYSQIEEKEKYKQYFDLITEYMNERIGKYVR